MGWIVRRTFSVTIRSGNNHGHKGDQYVVNGQQLKVFLEPDVVPIKYIDIYTLDGDPDRQG
jgi:hypothetical protein